uniref:Homeodomain mating-type protein n=1 Tax=Coprinellus disseminatus TaxID=71703 RepID=Q1WMN1_COPDI|nr:homeodomain mating-type protein [Coprinellus disseminatus]
MKALPPLSSSIVPPTRHILMETNHDADARQALEHLEEQFFNSLHDDEGSLLSHFYTSWSQFQEWLENAHPRLSPDTQADLTKFVAVMATVSDGLLETTSSKIADDLKADLMGEISHPQSSAEIAGVFHAPRYSADSLGWLRSNLHNPYPSRAVRDAIARKTACPAKDVDAWFVDFRKRIGWSRLRFSRFGNRKADIVDAATRFYTGSEPLRPLDAVIESEFASIAATVEELYYERCVSSPLASRLDTSIKDLTPDLLESLHDEKARIRSKVQQLTPPRRRRAPYPTPEVSPTLSPRPLSTPDSAPLKEHPATPSGSSVKRSRSVSSHCPTDHEGENIRPTKRTRRSVSVTETPGTSCYPSPAASVVIDLTDLTAEAPLSSKFEGTHSGKRKRAASDCEVSRTPPSPEPSGLPTSSTPLPLTPNYVLAQATHSSSSNPPAAISETAACDSFGPPDPFFPAFMHDNPPIGKCWFALAPHSSLTVRSGDLSLSFPLFFNIVDDTVPTDVLVDFDPSWANCSTDGLATSSVDTSITGYDMNFDNFGTGMYGGAMNSFGDSLWSGTPQLHSLASTSQSGSSASTLTNQLNVSPPSLTGVYDVASPSSPSPAKLPSALLTDKARELMELEARCAALRSELAGAS